MNMQNINAELRQKFKRMSPEQFEKYIHELNKDYNYCPYCGKYIENGEYGNDN